MKLNLSIKEISLIGMCAALMVIFSQLSIPLPFTAVPITLQIFGLVIISVIIGAKLGTLSIIVFDVLGAIGLPVFANFNGGLHVIIGPTGGYIIGFIIIAFLIGYASEKQNKILLFIASYMGLIFQLLLGTLQLKIVTGMNMQSALIAGFYPFVIKDLIMVTIAIVIGLRVKKGVKGILTRNAIA
ncbi:biotin transporter BioY [Clostridium sp.]|jgi:biotin transport system substrate-specific component|uniref:biotin transporter BioY n=1 Tax=Clostridium sp. TaxID=1506 RepID=UPI00283DF8D6|nr:biotin transporter BioY [Clostridium sp.]MDR3593624.1 biotin transporter BioY [Clostridium sp.]